MIHDLCISGPRVGEVPRDPRFRFRDFVFLDDPRAVRATGARYIVLQLDRWQGAPYADAPRCLAALSIPLSPGSYLPASPRAARETNRRRRRALASSADWQQGTNPAFAGTSSRAEKRPRGASPLWPGCCFHIFPRRLPNMGFLRSKTPERLAPRARDSPRSRDRKTARSSCLYNFYS